MSREGAREAHLTNKQGHRVFQEGARTVAGVERSKGSACQRHGKLKVSGSSGRWPGRASQPLWVCVAAAQAYHFPWPRGQVHPLAIAEHKQDRFRLFSAIFCIFYLLISSNFFTSFTCFSPHHHHPWQIASSLLLIPTSRKESRVPSHLYASWKHWEFLPRGRRMVPQLNRIHLHAGP